MAQLDAGRVIPALVGAKAPPDTIIVVGNAKPVIGTDICISSIPIRGTTHTLAIFIAWLKPSAGVGAAIGVVTGSCDL